MKSHIIELNFEERKISMTLIKEVDIEKLRLWKNQNREYFFNNKEITEIEQNLWYNQYISRDSDFMFVIKSNDIYIGCMGIRLIEDHWDAYNIILGNSQYHKSGIMSICFQKMLKFAHENIHLPIKLKVLKINPAVNWYIKQGFIIVNDKNDNYFEMNYIK